MELIEENYALILYEKFRRGIIEGLTKEYKVVHDQVLSLSSDVVLHVVFSKKIGMSINVYAMLSNL